MQQNLEGNKHSHLIKNRCSSKICKNILNFDGDLTEFERNIQNQRVERYPTKSQRNVSPAYEVLRLDECNKGDS